MANSEGPVFLLDVDNTLIDNDAIVADLMAHLEADFGMARRRAYQDIFEELRKQLGYADYLGALQRYRLLDIDDPHMLLMSSFLVDYPFQTRLFPHAIDLIKRLAEVGTPAVLSDGDVVFQPRKIQRSGIWDAVEGRVLIYIHKEEKIEAMKARFPRRQYVLIDDKVRILHAMKSAMGAQLTTVFPRQGHYAMDPKEVAAYPTPDLTIEHISDLLEDHSWAKLTDALAQNASKDISI